MDNQRLLIWAFFLLMAWFTWQQWQADYGPAPQQPVAERGEELTVAPEEAAGGAAAGAEDLPEISEPAGAESVPAAPQEAPQAVAAAPVVRVSTDVFDIEISAAGGTLLGATLKNYPVAKDRPDELVKLLDTTAKRLAWSSPASGRRAVALKPRTSRRSARSATTTTSAAQTSWWSR